MITVFKPFAILVLVSMALMCGETGCRSEEKNNHKGGAGAAPVGAAGAEGQPEINPAQWAEDQLVRAKANQRRMTALSERLASIQERVDAIPAATRQNAVDFEELDVQLEGFREKCTFIQDEMADVVRRLESHLSGKQMTKSPEPDANADMRQKLEEHESTLADFETAFDILDRAAATLKKSRDKPVRLFTE